MTWDIAVKKNLISRIGYTRDGKAKKPERKEVEAATTLRAGGSRREGGISRAQELAPWKKPEKQRACPEGAVTTEGRTGWWETGLKPWKKKKSDGTEKKEDKYSGYFSSSPF